MIPEWVAYANFGLNLLILPLIKVLFDIKGELIRLQTVLSAHIVSDETRLTRLERQQDVKK